MMDDCFKAMLNFKDQIGHFWHGQKHELRARSTFLVQTKCARQLLQEHRFVLIPVPRLSPSEETITGTIPPYF